MRDSPDKPQDFALLTVPFEALKRVSRDRKHLLETAGKILNELKSLNEVSNKQDPAVRSRAEQLVTSCQSLQQAATELKDREMELLEICDERAEHIFQVWTRRWREQLVFGLPRSAPEWDEARFDRILADYLFRNRYPITAQELTSLKKVQPLVDVQFFEEVDHIVVSLRQKQCQSALEWCRQNAARLKKQKSRLEFDLHCQIYVETVRQGDKLEALRYARTHLTPFSGQHMDELRHILVGVVVVGDNGWKRHQEVFDEQRWQYLERTFYRDALQMNNMPLTSPLELYLQTGLVALKPPPGYSETRNGQDPWSQKVFVEMSKNLPYAGHASMRLICPISGQVIDHENKGLLLPNKQVVAQQVVDELKVLGKDKVYTFTHPITGEMFTEAQWTKVRPV